MTLFTDSPSRQTLQPAPPLQPGKAKLRVGHLVHEMCGAASTFIYRTVTNPGVRNAVFCEKRSHQDLYPHPSVMTTQGSQRTKRFTRKFFGHRIATRLADAVHQREWKLFLSRYQPDVLHCQHGTHAARNLSLLQSSQRPFVVTFHGSDINSATFDRDYLHQLSRIFALADHCLFVSQALRDRAIELGAPSERSRVTYLGVKEHGLSAFQSARTVDCRFAVVASLIPCKGHETLLNAFQNVCIHLPRTTLHLFGKGPLLDRLQWLVHALQLEQRVVFHGEVNHAEVLRFLAEEIDVVIQSSQRDDAGREEGLPTSLCEAASMARGCIATDCGGISELIIDNKTGKLIPQRDVNQLTDAMIELALNSAVRAQLGMALHEHYKEMMRNGHGLEAITNVYEKACQATCC